MPPPHPGPRRPPPSPAEADGGSGPVAYGDRPSAPSPPEAPSGIVESPAGAEAVRVKS